MNEKININGRLIGEGEKTFIIAEIAQNHDGSLGMAHSYIDAIAETGVDAIKFQTHIANEESTPGEPWRIKFSYEDETRYDYWKRMEFTKDQWIGLKKHAEEKGLVFLSSPFSNKAVDLLHDIGMQAWKVPSGEINNYLLIDKMIQTGMPILFSSGMSYIKELDNIIQRVKSAGIPTGLFQCTSKYPVPPEEVGLNIIDEMKKRYGIPVGLSDHSANKYTSVSAVSLGAHMIEVHVTLSKYSFGPDINSSLTIEELKDMVQGIRYVKKILNNSVDKDSIAMKMTGMRRIFTKSLYYNTSLYRNQIVTENDIALKKPGIGLTIEDIDKIIGKKMKRDVKYNELVNLEDLED